MARTDYEGIDYGHGRTNVGERGVRFGAIPMTALAYPIGYKYNDGETVIHRHTNGDCFVIKSPVMIRAQFCSPCAPGAGHLQNPCPTGPLTYALPTDWFDAEHCPAPYTADDLLYGK